MSFDRYARNSMRATVLHAFHTPLRTEERPVPQPRGEEIVVRVKGTGVCHSDVHIADGEFQEVPLPRVLGHEIAGEAEGLGDVIVYAHWGCRRCSFCRSGQEQLCPEGVEAGWVRDGGYAEYLLVPSKRYLLSLEGLDPVHAAPLADAGVTPYRAIRRIRAWLQPGATAVLIGVGGLGQFAIQYLRDLTETRVNAVDRDPAKLRRARDLGASDAVLVEEAAGLGPESAQVVLDFVGSDSTLGLAAMLVRRAGIVVQVGIAGGTTPFGMGLLSPEVHFTSSVSGSLRDLQAVLELARKGGLDWHVESVPLEQVNLALDRVRRGDVLGRLVLVP
jgi:alcohol dehydrogenase, propanol-preferring